MKNRMLSVLMFLLLASPFFAKTPKNVVALSKSVAELWTLSGGTIAGTTDDALGLAGTENAVSIGTLTTASLEAILSVNPELVILTFDIPLHKTLNGNLKNTVNFENDCITASTNNNGWVTAILKNKGYRAQVAVYNNEGKLQYSWNSANNNVISAELSDDNKTLAVAQIDSISSAEANGVISLFDITTDAKPYCGKNTGENIATYIRWSGNSLICVGSDDTFCIDKSGKDIYSYKYPGEMVYFNAKTDDLFAFAINEQATP